MSLLCAHQVINASIIYKLTFTPKINLFALNRFFAQFRFALNWLFHSWDRWCVGDLVRGQKKSRWLAMFGGQTIKKATNSNIALVHEPDTMLIRDKKSPRRNVHFSNLRREKTLLVRFLWSIRFGIEVTDASNTLRLIPHTGSLDHNSATARFRYSHKSSHSHTHKNTTEKKQQQQHQL